MSHPLIATYRLQLHPGFTLDDAAGIVDYLAALGISHVYCSPYLQAARGSTHGYDVVDHRWVNVELGGEDAFTRFVTALDARGMSHVLDIVPNHMAIAAPENRWWNDVLEHGPSSYFASYFDVEWDPPEARLRNSVLLPVLEDHYGRVLDAHELALHRERANFTIRYRDHAFPVDPRSLGPVLARAARAAHSEDLEYLADAFAGLPRPTAVDRASVVRRHRDQRVLRGFLTRCLDGSPDCGAAIDDAIGEINADANRLHDLLEAQNYRLAFWRSAGRDLGYRRFFDINSLIGLRMEDAQVFEDTHSRVINLVRQGIIEGLRIDHPDGLRDPEEYFERLSDAAAGAWIVAEKILQPWESLPDTWRVAGTTGYEFAARVTALYTHPAGEAPLTRFYEEFTGEALDFARVAHERKREVLREILGSDMNRLTDVLVDICERQRRSRDYTRHQLADALREIVAAFPVYRTYVRPEAGVVRPADREYIATAVRVASAARTDIDASLFEFIGSLLVLEIRGSLEHEFVARFQQLTAPAMAKGVEDTAFYVYNRFIALNEVGGDPSRFSLSLDEFHGAQQETQTRRPTTMLTLSTHDTKRSGDVRARLALLSEIPDKWTSAVRRWSRINESHRTRERPDRNMEYFFYQTLVGAWPLSAERAKAAMIKAAREAKASTSWTSPDEAYEAALARFVEESLADPAFVEALERFVEPLVEPGRIASLSQTLLLLTSPGVPDLYQGTELWSLQLVDPDNRTPVDYDERRRALTEVTLDDLEPRTIWRRAAEGVPKLWLIREALRLRARRPAAFGSDGAYTPLAATGRLGAHVVAFQRGADVMTVVPRLVLGACGRWRDAELRLPHGAWRNVLTGATSVGDVSDVSLEEIWRDFPVALFEREGL